MTEPDATKICVFCAEAIKAAAVVCPHCGRWVGLPMHSRESLFRKLIIPGIALLIVVTVGGGLGFTVLHARQQRDLQPLQSRETTVSPDAAVLADRPLPPTATMTSKTMDFADPSDAALAYFRRLQPYLDNFRKAFVQLSALSERPQPASSEWKADLMTVVLTIRRNHEALLQMQDVPLEVMYIHELLLAATADYNEAAYYIESGVAMNSAPDLVRATELITSGTTKITHITELLPALEP